MIVPRRFPDVSTDDMSFPGESVPGESVRLWEKVFADYAGTKHAIAVGSGRLGMKMVLTSLNLQKESEVIIPAYTLKDLVPIIQSVGLKPVFADVDKETFNVTVETISEKVSSRTGAVIATHMFGNPCNAAAIVQFAGARGIKVIEDCAHSAGSAIDGRMTGSFGHAAFFSFETIKPINTYGGGMIVTDCDDLAEFVRIENEKCEGVTDISSRIKSARTERFMFKTSLAFLPLCLLAFQSTSRLMTWLYRHFQHPPTAPLRYSPLQACMGMKKIKTLDQRVKSRQLMAARIVSGLPDSIRMQKPLPGADHNWYFFVGTFPGDIREVKKYLLFHGYDSGIYSEIADYCPDGTDDACPNALALYNSALHLPLHRGMSEAALDKLLSLLCSKYG